MSIKKRIKINSEKEYYAVLNKLKEMGYDWWHCNGVGYKQVGGGLISYLFIDGRNVKEITASTGKYYVPSEPYVDWVPVFEDVAVCKDFVEDKPIPKYYEFEGKRYLLEEVETIFNKLLKPIEDA